MVRYADDSVIGFQHEEEAKQFLEAMRERFAKFGLALSKVGNRHIRSALYMPALSAKQHDPHVKAYFQHLVDNGKLPLQALCAVMRKLLHAIHGMLKHDKPFDNTRFYAIPA